MKQFFCPQNGAAVAISAGQRLGGGGEGNIFAVHRMPASVAKIFHTPSPDHRRKLEVMLSHPCVVPTRTSMLVAWPQGLLYADPAQRHFAGYLMPRVKGAQPVMEFYNPKSRRRKCPRFNYRYLLRAASNLTEAVQVAHTRGFVIGDLNESAPMVADNARVTMVDADSWQVRDPGTGMTFRCPVGKPDFTPPELQGKNLGMVNRTELHDRFALAVLLFKLQMEGVHPFDGIYQGAGDTTPIEARIAAGHFPYGKRSVPYAPKAMAPPFHILPPTVQKLFLRCFEDGHFDPRARPDARAWHDALQDAEKTLLQCGTNHQHWYGRHLSSCPWCERTHRMGGLDPFPPAGASYPTSVSIAAGAPVRRTVRRRTPSPRFPIPTPPIVQQRIVSPVHQLVQQSKTSSLKLGVPFPVLVIGIVGVFLLMVVMGTIAYVLGH